jgi:putative ABC transport system permease protein
MDGLIRDIRHALRLLWGNRGFAVAALVTIGLGVGGTTAVFSVVYGVLLRPLPYVDAGGLVRLWEEHPGANAPLSGAILSEPTYHAWLRGALTLDGLGAFRVSDSTLADVEGGGPGPVAGGVAGAAAAGRTVGAPQRVRVARVTGSMFQLLRVSPVAGRFFGEAESRVGAAPVAVLGYGTWRDRFGGDAGVIGRTVVVDGVAQQIIGVVPQGFTFPSRESGVPDASREVAVYAPLDVPAMDPAAKVIGIVSAVGRLRPGATVAQAEAEGTAYARSVDRPFAELVYGRGAPVEVRVRPIAEQMTMRVRPALLVLAVGIGLVLFVACANVANLFLSRGADRARELAVRAALGADRRRLLRQLLTESLVVALAGGLLGMFLGWALTAAVPALAPSGFPRLDDIHVDTWFVLIAVLAAVVVGTISGILPALRSSRVDLVAAMRAGDGRSTTVAGSRARRVLLIIEAALAVVLLIGATLLARSFATLVHVDAGYDATNVLTAVAQLPSAAAPRAATASPASATAAAAAGAPANAGAATVQGSGTTAREVQFAFSVLERVRALPGVRAAGAGSMSPFGSSISSSGFVLPGMTMADGQPLVARALQAVITPGYAEALGLRLKAGRFLRAEDATASTIAMLVNDTFATMYLSDGRPVVGRRFAGMFPRILGRSDAVVEIVGVVGDSLPDALDAQPQPQIFVPAGTGFRMGAGTFVIKTADDPRAIAPRLREIVRQVEPAATLDRVAPLTDKVADSVSQPRFAALVLASFALLALALAVTGLYAVLAYNVAQRRREIGLRAALGATRGDLVRMVVREGLTVTVIGLASGVALASLLTRAMRGLLFGVTPLDSVAFSAAPLLLLIVAAAACLIPARRAAALDPASVLKAE